MARFGTNINASLGRIDYTPYMQGAVAGSQAIGQGIAALGQAAGKAIEKNSELRAMVGSAKKMAGAVASAPNIPPELKAMIDNNIKALDDPNLSLREQAEMSKQINDLANGVINRGVSSFIQEQENARRRTQETNDNNSMADALAAAGAGPRVVSAVRSGGKNISPGIFEALTQQDNLEAKAAQEQRNLGINQKIANIATTAKNETEAAALAGQAGVDAVRAVEMFGQVNRMRQDAPDQELRLEVIQTVTPDGRTITLPVVRTPKGLRVVGSAQGDPTQLQINKNFEEENNRARQAYEAGDNQKAVEILRSLGLKPSLGGGFFTVDDLPSYFGKLEKEEEPVIVPAPEQPNPPPAGNSLFKIINVKSPK